MRIFWRLTVEVGLFHTLNGTRLLLDIPHAVPPAPLRPIPKRSSKEPKTLIAPRFKVSVRSDYAPVDYPERR